MSHDKLKHDWLLYKNYAKVYRNYKNRVFAVDINDYVYLQRLVTYDGYYNEI